MTAAPPPVGLYSISVRGYDVPSLLAWSYAADIPFLHLRGGPRGFALTQQTPARLRQWRTRADQTVPVTGVTADVDLAELTSPDPSVRHAARSEVGQLADAAAVLGAQWVRLLAATAPDGEALHQLRDAVVDEAAVPLLVELHDPRWLRPGPLAALEDFLDAHPYVHVLADTAQLAAATGADATALDTLTRVAARTRVLHLSHHGPGLATAGHREVTVAVASHHDPSRKLEVAVEFTGSDRTPRTALGHYRSAAAWWTSTCDAHP